MGMANGLKELYDSAVHDMGAPPELVKKRIRMAISSLGELLFSKHDPEDFLGDSRPAVPVCFCRDECSVAPPGSEAEAVGHWWRDFPSLKWYTLWFRIEWALGRE